MAFSLQTSNYPLLLKPGNHHTSAVAILKFRTFCCSNGSIRVNATRYKRKLRPSFFEQIRHKWSTKPTSTREKFPWQQQEQQKQEEVAELEEEDEGETEKMQAFGVVMLESEIEESPPATVSNPVSFTLPNRSVKAPWTQGIRPRKSQFDSESKGDNFNGFVQDANDFVNTTEVFEKEVTGNEIFEVKEVKFDSSAVLTRESEPALAKYAHDVVNEVEILEEEVTSNDKCKKEKVKFDANLAVLTRNNAAAMDESDDVVSKVGNLEMRVTSNGKFNKEEDKFGAYSAVSTRDREAAMDKYVNDGVNKVENLKKEVTCNGKFKNEEIEVDATSIVLTRDEEPVVVYDANKVDFRNEKLRRNSGNDQSAGGSAELPWKREGGEGRRRTRSNTELAERMLPEHELKRLRNVSLRMLERIKVGAAGITQDLVDAIHRKWKLDEVVKLKFEEPHSSNMKRTHEILESRTGGLVIWRSGSSVVLYRGMAYKFQCVQSFAKQNVVDMEILPDSRKIISMARSDDGLNDMVTLESFIPSSSKYLRELSQEELTDFSELNHLLDELGPRYIDWSGREPLPVDADLLPPVVPGYRTPFRLLPYGIRDCLKNKEMTMFRRQARMMPPHFALGRNRELQGLAKAMVKLWEKCAIAKIAIKRGVQNTHNERMAEELKRLTGGTLLSRNKEYIVFYRGNDFLPPAVTETLKEREKLTFLHQDKEDHVRQLASTFAKSNAKNGKKQLIAGTLAETMAASSRWGNAPSSKDVEKMMRDSALERRILLVKHLKNKLSLAKGRLKKADKALAKVQEHLEPRELPTDLETLTDEERFLYRKIGLSMKPYLLLGRRDVFSGTIENMHLHWKYRELVKIIVKRKNFAQVKQIAINLEAESGGVLVSVDRTIKGIAIIVYRGKNYVTPQELKPVNLLTKRQALARSIELQRREALKYHIADLQERIQLVKSEVEDMKVGKNIYGEAASHSDDSYFSSRTC